MNDFGLRLACYDIDGDLRGRARGMLIERYARAGEAGRLLVDFSELAPRSGLFDATPAAGLEIAVEYLAADGVTWVEPEDGRYVIAQNQHERTADPTNTHDLSLLGIVQRLNAAKVLTAPQGELQTDGKRQFLSRTPGEIIGTLLAEAKARGAVTSITAGFTATHDSNGNPWTAVYNRAYELSHSLLNILQNLYDGGAVDYWLDGRTLHMVPAGQRGRDLTLGLDPVYLRDLYAEASPERDDWTRLANHVVLIGDEGARWEKTNPAAITPFGRVETVILAGGVSDAGTATVMMDRALAEGADVARQLTREWQWHPDIRWMPDRDLRVGDWVLADTAVGTRQRVKIADVMCRQGPDGIEAFVTLGTIADDLLTRMAKRQLGIEGGAGVGSIGTPTPAPPPDPTDRWPERPTGLTVDVSAWPIPGGYGAVIGASWDEVTVDTGGFAMDVDGYILRARRQGGPWLEMFRTGSLSGQAERTDMRPGETWEAQVAAYWGERTGIWSTLWTGEVPEDIQAPPVPSAPVLESPVGQLVVNWDGLSESGSSMPLDLKQVEIELNGATDPEHWKISPTGGSRRFDPPTVQIGTMYTVRLRAVDHAGNASEWSDPAFSGITATVAWPAVPPSVLASADSYLTAEGAYRGRISASWGEVTQDGDGNPLDIAGYAIRVRRTIGHFTVDWFDLGGTPNLSFTGSSALMEVGDTWEVQVAAVSTDGHTGPFSTPVSVVIPPDTVAPPIPSAPIVTSDRGLLIIDWDGLNQAGGGMPLDLHYLVVHITGLTETWRIDPTIRRVAIPGLAVGTTYEARLSAVDYAGNESDPSQPAAPTAVASVLSETDWAEKMAEATSYGENLYPDALFNEPGRNTLRENAGWTITAGEGRITPASTAQHILWLTPTGATTTNAALIPGDTYQLSWRIQAGPAQLSMVAVRALDGQPPIEMHAPVAQAANSDQAWNYTITAVAGYRYGIAVTNAPTLYNLTLRKRITSTLLGPESVTSDKIYANQSMAAKFSGMLGEFDQVFAGTIEAGMLAVDALNFKTAEGLSLTAPVIQSTSTANRGLKLTTSYKRVYDDTGNITLEENYTTGDVTMTGRFQTRGAYPHLDIGRGLWADFAGMQWTIGPGWQTKPEIITNASKWGNDLAGGFYFRGGNRDGLTMRPEVALRSGRTIGGVDSFWPEVDLVLGLGATTHGRRRLRDEGTNTTSIYDWANFIRYETKTGQAVILNEPGSPGDVRIASSSGGVLLQAGNGWITAQGIGTTAGGQDMALEGSWRLAYRSSMSHLKLEQEPIPAIPAVLALQPKTWVDRYKREEDPGYDTRNFGFIAEEAEELITGLSEVERRQVAPLVAYYDRGGELNKSIPYGQLVALLWPLVRVLWEDRFGPIDGVEPQPRRAANARPRD